MGVIMNARERFLNRRSQIQKQQPFTPKEDRDLSPQQKNFVRGIQVARHNSKKEAIRLFRKSQKSKTLSKSLSKDIDQKYKTGTSITEYQEKITKPPKLKPSKKPKKPKKLKKPKTRYKYRGVTKKATKKQIARFRSLGETSRRYIDTYTGEEISRRERDKRLS